MNNEETCEDKRFSKGMIAGVVLLASLSGCKTGPQADECLQTIYDCDAGNPPRCSIVADCVHPDGKAFERKGHELDGDYTYTPNDRSIIIKWARENCKAAQ